MKNYDLALLAPIEAVLGKAADFSTLWNYRREILLNYRDQMQKDNESLVSKVGEVKSNVPDPSQDVSKVLESGQVEFKLSETNEPKSKVPDSGEVDFSMSESSKSEVRISESGDSASKIEEKQQELEKLCRHELYFIENCLRENPKSYSVWNHRVWMITEFMPNPDLKRELELCNEFVQLDGRNCKWHD